jgi:hypothetical protein
VNGYALLSACTSPGDNITGVEQITPAPGDTGTCEASPCQVSLRIPAGTGSYEVTANEVKVGCTRQIRQPTSAAFGRARHLRSRARTRRRPTPIYLRSSKSDRNYSASLRLAKHHEWSHFRAKAPDVRAGRGS